jgi:hypothetical protein
VAYQQKYTPTPPEMFMRTTETTAGIDHKEPIEVWVYYGPYKYSPERLPTIEVMYRDEFVVLSRSAPAYNYALNKGRRDNYSCYNFVGVKKFKKDTKMYKRVA